MSCHRCDAGRCTTRHGRCTTPRPMSPLNSLRWVLRILWLACSTTQPASINQDNGTPWGTRAWYMQNMVHRFNHFRD